MTERRMLAVVAAMVMGCGAPEGVVVPPRPVVATAAGLSWEAFLTRAAWQEPDTGVWIADGDTPFFSEAELRHFYETSVLQGQLIVGRTGSRDDAWSATQRTALTYCVSDAFGRDKAEVVAAMAEATGAWMNVADVHFEHRAASDRACTARTDAVLFDVRPVNARAAYLARAFFPSTARHNREVLIDGSAFTAPGLTLAGVLRHELGHALGFRHEHTRPEAGACFEDRAWRALTRYDPASVMHYPQCNGEGAGHDFPLTALDAQGAAALYGPPRGAPPPRPVTGGGPRTERATGSVAEGALAHYDPVPVRPGTRFHATLTGEGDPDLYLRFDTRPSPSLADCASDSPGATEDCDLTVPAGSTHAFLLVHGYTAASYTLTASWTAP